MSEKVINKFDLIQKAWQSNLLGGQHIGQLSKVLKK